MALTGLDIYKLLPKTNCKACGFATCLAFAMALAQKKTSLDKCPTVSAEAKAALESASQPPIKLVTIGAGDSKFQIGNELVMYRHEQKFFNPAVVALSLDDRLDDKALSDRVGEIKALEFERVGVRIRPQLVCVMNGSQDKVKFAAAVKASIDADMAIALYSSKVDSIKAGLAICGDRRPLVICGDNSNVLQFAALAKESSLPLAITAGDINTAAETADAVKKLGVDEIVINFTGAFDSKIKSFTYARRSALKKNLRQLGYPVMAFTQNDAPGMELAEAVAYIAKYASIVVVKNAQNDVIYPMLVARQDIYTDPQKPVQVESRIYEIGKTGPGSPVIVTTNFSITYFTVAGEIESSKVPCYLICSDSDGMSVLTAWAAEKFTAEKITELLKSCGIEGKIGHKSVIIPGYVSVLSGKLREVSGWDVIVGPREASGIPAFLRNYK